MGGIQLSIHLISGSFTHAWGPVGTVNSFLKLNSDTLKHLSIGIDYLDSISYQDHQGARPPFPLL